MPLWVLVIIVVIGLTLVIGAVHVFGGKRAGSLDERAARNVWRQEFGDDTNANVVVSDDRSTAFLTLEDDAVGLVRQMGAHHIVRRLDAGSVVSIRDSGKRLDLRLNETTLPRVKATIADDAKRAEAIAMLETLIAKEGSFHA